MTQTNTTDPAATPTSTTSRKRNPDILGDGNGNYRLAVDGSIQSYGFKDTASASKWVDEHIDDYDGKKVICVRVCALWNPTVEVTKRVRK